MQNILTLIICLSIKNIQLTSREKKQIQKYFLNVLHTLSYIFLWFFHFCFSFTLLFQCLQSFVILLPYLCEFLLHLKQYIRYSQKLFNTKECNSSLLLVTCLSTITSFYLNVESCTLTTLLNIMEVSTK